MLEPKGTFKRLVQLLNFLWDVWVPGNLGLAQGHNKCVGLGWTSIYNASRTGMGASHIPMSKTSSFNKETEAERRKGWMKAMQPENWVQGVMELRPCDLPWASPDSVEKGKNLNIWKSRYLFQAKLITQVKGGRGKVLMFSLGRALLWALTVEGCE